MLHKNNLEQDGAGYQVAKEVMGEGKLVVVVEVVPGYLVAAEDWQDQVVQEEVAMAQVEVVALAAAAVVLAQGEGVEGEEVNLPLVDKADNQVNMDNLVIHKDNLERDGAGLQVAVEEMGEGVLQVAVEAGPGYHVAVVIQQLIRQKQLKVTPPRLVDKEDNL